jgi:hypothetical protein
MAPLRGLKTCAKLKGVDFVHVGTFGGRERNRFAPAIPTLVSEACRRQFVTALAKVRQQFDLSPLQPSSERVALGKSVAKPSEQEHDLGGGTERPMGPKLRLCRCG